ncbi:MAG: SDR family oxidoreductase [Planctomycetales bacterium]|nr:SDR family oxidoreductase [Planctomycetales bacterium]
MNLKGRVAVITGASLGIGRAAAIEMARSGAQVVINYRQHADEAEQVVRAVRDEGSQAIAVQADVSDVNAVEQLVERAVAEFGKVDILVSNAVYSDRELFHEADLAGFRRTIDVTMWGAFYAVRCAARQMIKQQSGGAICIVSSPHAFIPVPRSMAYNMAKAAVDQMARTAACELAEHRIRVNILHPGWTDTPGERKFFDDSELLEKGSELPWGRLARPDEIARGVVFLCDPASEYVNGTTLSIDGGSLLPHEQMFRVAGRT